MTDNVNHPQHYESQEIMLEPIDFFERYLYVEFDSKNCNSNAVIAQVKELLRIKLAKLFGDNNGAIVSLQED